MKSKNLPQKPGIYFGKTGTYEWFNVVTFVIGEAPFLKIEALYDRIYGKLVSFDASDITEWSDAVKVPGEAE